MGLDVPNRVHIIPVGYEHRRIVEPAQEYRADKVVLIGHEGDEEGSQGDQHLRDALSVLEQNNIEIQIKECDLFDLYSSLGAIAEAISAHEGDRVYVNVATGSKVTAIAGMIASMVLESTPYYVRARNYEDVPDDLAGETELPTYPIDAPDSQQVDVMQFIQVFTEEEDAPPTKGDLIHFSDHRGMEYISKNVASKGKYRLLDKHILGPLQQRGYVSEAQEGRNKRIGLTEDGRAALEAFRWLIDEEIDWKDIDEVTARD